MLCLRTVQAAEPGPQALLHARLAFADLGGQGRVEKVLAIFQVVLIHRGVKLADLLFAQALQQFDGGGGDLDADTFERGI